MTRKILTAVLALTFFAGLVTTAQARDNERYGETRWNNLPLKGMVSKTVWVGSWWAYGTDGLSFRGVHDDSLGYYSGWEGYAGKSTRWDNKDDGAMSPAEKFDKLSGRLDKVQYDALMGRSDKVHENRTAVKSLIDERRTLIRTLNKMIKENNGDPTFNWADSDEGKRYKEIGEEITTKETEATELTVDVDTAFEWEVLNHGTAQFNVEGWYGHCNAWAAAAIMEPEPRFATTVDGIEFTAGDVKAYLTELWMEQQSSFHGSRNEYHEDQESRDAIDYQDVTPAGFHIFFSDQIGNRDKSFVIDRYTGSQVWNQPVKAFRSKVEPLYEGEGVDAIALKRDVKLTTYGYGDPKLEERGEQDVYPVLVTTTIHWITDGLPHETLTVAEINNDIDDETFASSYRIREMWHDQVEIRTLTYELWLDKPMEDPEARIIGDGQWEHGSASNYAHLQPDFMWQPTANVNNSRDYENDYISYNVVVDRILPGTLKPADDPAVVPDAFTAAGPIEIPDADKETPALLDIEVTAEINVGEMVLDVDISHTYIGDLRVTLVSPDGKRKVLKKFGSFGGQDDIKRSYDVKHFDGLPALGTWQLDVRDQWKQDTGVINSATLHIK